MVFLPNYDIAMARLLYPGTDVWLNNPLRPLEACGTSGMKAALNGSLNLSILDGWWAEFYDEENGWAIPSADAAGDADERDELEAEAMYDLIEHQVAPRFYDDRTEDGVPTRWVDSIRHTLATLSPRLSADRMVREYVERLYIPATGARRALAANSYAAAREFAAWKAARRRSLARRPRRPCGIRRGGCGAGGRRRVARAGPGAAGGADSIGRRWCRSCTAAPMRRTCSWIRRRSTWRRRRALRASRWNSPGRCRSPDRAASVTACASCHGTRS